MLLLRLLLLQPRIFAHGLSTCTQLLFINIDGLRAAIFAITRFLSIIFSGAILSLRCARVHLLYHGGIHARDFYIYSAEFCSARKLGVRASLANEVLEHAWFSIYGAWWMFTLILLAGGWYCGCYSISAVNVSHSFTSLELTGDSRGFRDHPCLLMGYAASTNQFFMAVILLGHRVRLHCDWLGHPTSTHKRARSLWLSTTSQQILAQVLWRVKRWSRLMFHFLLIITFLLLWEPCCFCFLWCL